MTAAWTSRIAVFDLETTGVDPHEARIVTAFIGILNGAGEVIEQWSWLANPGVEIPAAASAIHGVTTERAIAEGVPAAGVVTAIVSTLRDLLQQGIPVCAYNAAYDFSVLSRESARHSIEKLDPAVPVIDPLVIDKALDRYRRGKRTLEVSCATYGVTLEGAHDAAADAIAAGRLAQAIAAKFSKELDISLAELHAQQERWATQQAESFADWMRTTKDHTFQPELGWPVREIHQ
ncbi:exonuclease domain-containing protein [Humidisolicoccus flavus]|uniref:exonuclease domain-containing protein n=1 Tax=Humidisolicoccus flavus TaxID=3111414 RepID=UPI00324C53E6